AAGAGGRGGGQKKGTIPSRPDTRTRGARKPATSRERAPKAASARIASKTIARRKPAPSVFSSALVSDHMVVYLRRLRNRCGRPGRVQRLIRKTTQNVPDPNGPFRPPAPSLYPPYGKVSCCNPGSVPRK